MSFFDVMFCVVALVTVGSAAIVVLSRSLIYSAFALLFTFFGVAIIYVFLGADFLAATQVLIYVGGILILLLFGVMLTHRLYNLNLKTETFQLIPGLIDFTCRIHFAGTVRNADPLEVGYPKDRPSRPRKRLASFLWESTCCPSKLPRFSCSWL